jgi:SAM-dependent methyltransferase
MRMKMVASQLDGYGSMVVSADPLAGAPDSTTDTYAQAQVATNVRVTREYLEPILRRTGSRSVVDVGCGVGTSVTTLLEDGYDAFGVDLAPLTRYWRLGGAEASRFFVVDAGTLALPFEDGVLDFAVSLGAIEHVGTVDGHATRCATYHQRRRQWLREIYRVVRPGGHLLVGGPNRHFPLDFSHGLDAEASPLERSLTRLAGVSIHRTWGDYFLWGYEDVPKYLAGLEFRTEALSIDGLLQFGRVPALFRSLARLYVQQLPRPALATGLNPWVMALVTKGANQRCRQPDPCPR